MSANTTAKKPTWRTEDGVEVTLGDRVYNYYDMRPGVIMAAKPSSDWFEFQGEDGSTDILNGQRVCSIDYARRQGFPRLGYCRILLSEFGLVMGGEGWANRRLTRKVLSADPISVKDRAKLSEYMTALLDSGELNKAQRVGLIALAAELGLEGADREV